MLAAAIHICQSSVWHMCIYTQTVPRGVWQAVCLRQSLLLEAGRSSGLQPVLCSACVPAPPSSSNLLCSSPSPATLLAGLTQEPVSYLCSRVRILNITLLCDSKAETWVNIQEENCWFVPALSAPFCLAWQLCFGLLCSLTQCQAGTTCGASSQADLTQNLVLKTRMFRFSRHSRQNAVNWVSWGKGAVFSIKHQYSPSSYEAVFPED